MKFHTPLADAIKILTDEPDVFVTLFTHGSLQLELYQPDQVDHQSPHNRDELYVIASGQGEFLLEDQRIRFQSGDVLHVPAGLDHRFVNFSEDFKTWVIFYGPIGGEMPA